MGSGVRTIAHNRAIAEIASRVGLETLFKESPSAHVEEEDPEYKAQHQILRSGIDPIAWQTELERVGPRLRVAAAHAGGKEWRAHIDATKSNEAKIREVLPATKKQLTAMAERVSDARDKINLKENYINKQFEAKKESFATLKEELTTVEAAFTESTENVNNVQVPEVTAPTKAPILDPKPDAPPADPTSRSVTSFRLGWYCSGFQARRPLPASRRAGSM